MKTIGKLLLLLLVTTFIFLGLPYGREEAPTEPVAEPISIVQTIPQPPEPKAAPNAVGQCTITYYDPCALCCGKTDAITASGTTAVPYETCAVDPSVIPLGSTVLVDFGDGILRRYRAEDTGNGVGGNHMDICVESHEKALSLGVKQAEVWWEEEQKRGYEGG